MKVTGEVTLETEYEKIKDIDIDDWEMVRGEMVQMPALRIPSDNFLSFQVRDRGKKNQLNTDSCEFL